MDKQIPLSELIRIGSKVTGQCFGQLVSIDDEQEVRTCALGAALVAKRGETPNKDYGFTGEDVEELLIDDKIEKHPMTTRIDKLDRLPSIIISLNDSYKWSREKIADWLQSIGM